jgi:biopolymer transport protein ExbB
VRLLWVFAFAGCAYRAPSGQPPTDEPDASVDALAVDPDASPAPTPLRKPITILGTRVTGTLANFPVWIEIGDAELVAGARADGTDIFFSDADGNALDHEVQTWDPSVPVLRAWVRIPSLTTVDTVIHVEYGDVTRAIAPNPAGVFVDFAAVWHLEDSLSTSSIADATGSTPGTAAMLAPTARGDGQLGHGIVFDGATGSSIAFTNMLTGSMPHTITAWVTQASVTQGSSVVSVGTSGNGTARFMYGHRSGVAGPAPFAVGYGSDDLFMTGHDLEDAGWTMLAWTFEGTNRRNHVYRDGVELTPTAGTQSNTAATVGTTGLIGLGLPNFSFAPMKGTLDEVRISTVVRPPGWIATEFRNQVSPSTFYAVGPEEPVP